MIELNGLQFNVWVMGLMPDNIRINLLKIIYWENRLEYKIWFSYQVVPICNHKMITANE